MTSTEPMAREVAATAAMLLDQGSSLDRLSRPLTVAALIGLLLAMALGGREAVMVIAALALVALAGIIEAYFAIRVGLDAALFRHLATSEAADPAALDGALLRLRLMPETKAGRAALDRAVGARRLLHRQAAALIVQLGLVFLGAGLAAAGWLQR